MSYSSDRLARRLRDSEDWNGDSGAYEDRDFSFSTRDIVFCRCPFKHLSRYDLTAVVVVLHVQGRDQHAELIQMDTRCVWFRAWGGIAQPAEAIPHDNRGRIKQGQEFYY